MILFPCPFMTCKHETLDCLKTLKSSRSQGCKAQISEMKIQLLIFVLLILVNFTQSAKIDKKSKASKKAGKKSRPKTDKKSKKSSFDYQAPGESDSPEKREWLKMWNEARQQMFDALQKDEAGSDDISEQEVNQAESGGAEQAEDEEKWKEVRRSLIDAFTVKKSTAESELRAGNLQDFGLNFGKMSWDRSMRFYAEPGHRRGRLKWIQTTNETGYLFKAYKLGDHLRELAKEAKEGKAAVNGGRNETQTLWAPRIPKAISHRASGHQDSPISKLDKIDIYVEKKLDDIVTKKVQELYQFPRTGSSHLSEQGEGAQNELDCDPDARCQYSF